MVVYQCKKCCMDFSKKYDYDNHIARKKPCSILTAPYKQKKAEIKCKQCGTEFTRKDSLARHMKICAENVSTIETNTTIDGSHNNTNGASNNVNIYPFCAEPYDVLTDEDKLKIASCIENPIIEAILCSNLDPSKKNCHNVGYPDNHSAYGIVFNGEEWKNECVYLMLYKLIQVKIKWILEVCEDLKDVSPTNRINYMKKTATKLNNIINPRSDLAYAAKKTLFAHLKKYFYNERGLVLNARNDTDNTASITSDLKTNTIPDFDNIDLEKILKKDITLEMAKEDIGKKNKIRLLKKEIALDLLEKLMDDEITDNQYDLISEMIKNESNMKTIDIISRSLTSSLCRGNKITFNAINKKIKKEEHIENYILKTINQPIQPTQLKKI